MANPAAFNVPIGFDQVEAEESVAHILKLAASYRSRNEYHAAHLCYRRAAATSTQGQLEYARFLLEVAYDKKVPWAERLRQAEGLLLPLSNSENRTRAIDACVALSTLYTRCRKPLSAFGYMLRAHNLAGTVDRAELERIARDIERTSIHAGSKDPHGAYITGMELGSLDSSVLVERAKYLLQLAVENGRPGYAGLAALRLAELMEQTQDSPAAISQYMSIAALHGNADVPA